MGQGNTGKMAQLLITQQKRGNPVSSGLENQESNEGEIEIKKLAQENDREIDILKQEIESIKSDILKLQRVKLPLNSKVTKDKLYVKDNENKQWYLVSSSLVKKDLDRSSLSLVEKDKEDEDDKNAFLKKHLK